MEILQEYVWLKNKKGKSWLSDVDNSYQKVVFSLSNIKDIKYFLNFKINFPFLFFIL